MEIERERHPKLTEYLVQLALASWVDWYANLVVPNFRLYHDMDLAVLSKAGLLHEYEIKLSQADWERDKDKDVTPELPAGYSNAPPGNAPGQRGYYEELWCRPRRNLKHVSRFTYVFAQGLKCPGWVDARCGLLEVRYEVRQPDAKYAYIVFHPGRPAQRRSEATKPNELCAGAMLRSIYHRFWNGLRGLPVSNRAKVMEVQDNEP